MKAAKRAPAVSPLADGLITTAVAVLVIVGIAPAVWRYVLRSGAPQPAAHRHSNLYTGSSAEAGSRSLPMLGCWANKQAFAAAATQHGLGASVALLAISLGRIHTLNDLSAYLPLPLPALQACRPPLPMYRCRSAKMHMALSEKLYAEYATLQLPVLAAHPVAEALHRSADLTRAGQAAHDKTTINAAVLDVIQKRSVFALRSPSRYLPAQAGGHAVLRDGCHAGKGTGDTHVHRGVGYQDSPSGAQAWFAPCVYSAEVCCASHPVFRVLCTAGLTQFSPWLRDQHLRLHRITGYIFSALRCF